MRKLILLIAFLATFFSCGKENTFTDTCISSCSPSTPGRINIAVEDHTGLDIRNLTMEINGTVTNFSLFPKAEKGAYSCWQSFDKVDLITSIQFEIGDNATHIESVAYNDLTATREYSIDIRSDEVNGISVQLVSSPDCVSSAN